MVAPASWHPLITRRGPLLPSMQSSGLAWGPVDWRGGGSTEQDRQPGSELELSQHPKLLEGLGQMPRRAGPFGDGEEVALLDLDRRSSLDLDRGGTLEVEIGLALL